MGQSVNTFTELNTDSHPVNTKPVVMTDAINATLTTKGENQLILQNMEGTHIEHQLTEGFRPLGVEVFDNIAYIVSGRFDNDGVFIEGEIGTFPSPDWSNLVSGGLDPEFYLPFKNEYSPLRNFSTSSSNAILNNDANYTQAFRSTKLNFQNDRLIEVELQLSYDNSVNIIFTDDYNPVRLINSRFKAHERGNTAAIADRRQSKDTNTYSDARFGVTKLQKQSDIIPTLTFNGVIPGGNWNGGGYRFYFRYSDSDGALTDIIEESRLVSVAFYDHGAKFNENTGRAIQFTMSNLDQKFSGIKVYYSHASGDTDTTTAIHEITNIYDITGDSKVLFLTGDEDTILLDRGTLNLDYSSIDTVKTITQFNDRLIYGNISSNTESYEELRTISRTIEVGEINGNMKIKGLGEGYADPDNVYFNLGYWAGETYEIGVVYILKDGRGNTPAFPTRGLDQYDSNNSYTSATPGSDGFMGLSTENALGAYRTAKERRMLTGVESDSTDVRYFQAYMDQVKADPFVMEHTQGFFFVRKERKRDAIVQGYLTNTCMEPVSNKTALVDSFYTGIGEDEWFEDSQHITGFHSGIGVDDFDGSIPLKILPAPGRIFETTIDTRSDVDNAGDPVSMQGIVRPNPQITDSGTKGAKNMYYAFYSADALADAPLMASRFAGSAKGILRNDVATEASQFLRDSTFDGTNHGRYIYKFTTTNQDNVDFSIGHNDDYTIEFDGTMTVTGESSTLGDLIWRGQVPVRIRFKRDGLDEDAITVRTRLRFIAIFSGGQTTMHTTSIIEETINYDINMSMAHPTGSSSTFFNTEFPSMSQGDLTQLKIRVNTLRVTDKASGEIYTLNFSNTNSLQNTIDLTLYKKEFVSIHNISMSSISGEPIKNLDLKNYNFTPTSLADPASLQGSISLPHNYRNNYMQYVGTGQNSFSGGTFSAVSDRNLYYTSPLYYDDDLNYKFRNGTPETGRNNARMFGVTNTQFSDYIGLRMDLYDPVLTNLLRNDTHAVSNYNNQEVTDSVFHQLEMQQNRGISGYDLQDWIWAVQYRGFRLGVQINVYENNDGVSTPAVWKNKYANTNLNEQYFAITKRYSWDDMPNFDLVSIFDGDCYVGHVYKTVSQGLGIPGIPTANDPTLYEDANRDTGLYPKGFVFPLVSENNYNTTLRSFDDHSAVEKTIYGKDRSFYPIDDIDALRASRQPESTGYNHGYDFGFSDKNYVSLNDRAPVLNIDYSNRIMISSPSVAGNFQNGYTDFSGLNFRDYNKQLGEITKVITHNNNAYCIFENGIGIIPVDQRTMISEATGGVFLDDATTLASKMQIISSEYGSDQQFSVIKTDTAIYGVDLQKNKIWRITENRLDIISDFAIQSIINKYKNRLTNNRLHDVVKTNYDRERNNVVFSYMSEFKGIYSTDLYNITYAAVTDGKSCPTDTVGYSGSNTKENRPYYASPTSGELSEQCCELIGGYYEESSETKDGFRCFNSPKALCPLDMISTNANPPKYESASGEEVTRECCESIGGFWESSADARGGECYVTQPEGKTNIVEFTEEDGIIERTKGSGDVSLIDKGDPVSNGNVGEFLDANGLVVTLGGRDEWDNIIPILIKKNDFGSVYWNETLSKWVSRLSWNPLFMFNLESNLYSFNATGDREPLWKHFSDQVPRCHFYGNQDKFIFEFMVVDNPAGQKILNNLMLISNRTFPGRVTYGLIEDDVDYETYAVINNGSVELKKQRHETKPSVGWLVTPTTFAGQAYVGLGVSKEETERLKGGYVVFNNIIYIVGDSYENNGVFYNEILNQNGIGVSGSLPAGFTFNSIEFGIIQQNMEYLEDHLYIECGRDETKSRIRDKAIRVRIMYEGYDYVTVQSVISQFIYSYG